MSLLNSSQRRLQAASKPAANHAKPFSTNKLPQIG